MRKVVVLVFTITWLSIPNIAQAGILGTKCSNSGATITSGGTKYVCKNTGGKLKWQKPPTLTTKQRQKAIIDCVNSLTGNSNWSWEDLQKADAICVKRFPVVLTKPSF